MSSLLVALFALVSSSFRTHPALQAEILALRHQLAVFQKNAAGRLRLQRSDRFLWVLLSRFWSGWAPMPADGSTGNGPPLAPESFHLVLDQQISASSRQARSSGEHFAI